jgi:hypothetical protein
MGRSNLTIEKLDRCDIDFPCGFKITANAKSKNISIRLHKKKCEFCRTEDFDIVKQTEVIDNSRNFSKETIKNINANNMAHLIYKNVDINAV